MVAWRTSTSPSVPRRVPPEDERPSREESPSPPSGHQYQHPSDDNSDTEPCPWLSWSAILLHTGPLLGSHGLLLYTVHLNDTSPVNGYVFSHRRWSSWKLARQFAHTVLARFLPQGPTEQAGDDTVTEHPGPNVYGKDCHRDPVHSTHLFTAFRWRTSWSCWQCWCAFRSTRGGGHASDGGVVSAQGTESS
jgi:hypothetical protein